MSEIITSNPSVEGEKFLVYPDFQASFEGHSGLYGVIMNYKSKLERLFETMDQIRDWKSDSMVNFSRMRFQKLANLAKNEQQKVKYQNLSEVWTPEDNYELARKLYEVNLDILGRYAFAYDDIRCREDSKKNTASVVTPIFNKLPAPIAMELNLELVFESRLKTWYSAVQKLITKTEILNLSELQNYNDIYACRFIVSSGVGKDYMHDYDDAEHDCYRTMNAVIRHIIKLGGELIETNSVGETSKEIWEEYREKVKDYIANPKSNGYKALHACFEVPIGKNSKIRFEVQVLSSFMYYINELKAPHILHKENTKLDLVFDPTKVRLEKFYAGYREDKSMVIVDLGEGLLEPKVISPRKIFHKH